MEAATKEELFKKTFEGERNVLLTKIEAFDRTVKEQREQLLAQGKQLSDSYQKVQDIAVKSVAGASELKATVFSNQGWSNEPTKKQNPERFRD